MAISLINRLAIARRALRDVAVLAVLAIVSAAVRTMRECY